MKDIEKISDETLAVYHILKLAEQGRHIEIVAQLLASAWLCGEVDGEWVRKEASEIQDRTLSLMLNACEIWPGLLPGPPGVDGLDQIETRSNQDWANLQDANGKLEKISELLSKPRTTTGDAKAWEALREIEEALGGNPDAIVRHEPNSIDMYNYVVSIIIDPRIRHDESSDLIEDCQNISSESPLNLASHVWDRIDHIDKVGRWPAEELSAWITHTESDSHWIMTWDQASGLKALDTASQHLETEMYNEYQGVSDMMSIAGDEYIAGKQR